jgi:uncharacterized protein YbbC (DUF1343 family)/CubicO group peptidase (beta-lactamase class C family)
VSPLAAVALWLVAGSGAAQPAATPARQQPAPPPTASSPAAPTRVAPPTTQRPAAGVDPERLARIDQIVEAAIKAGNMPGAVALVGHRGRIVYRKAFGQRAVAPAAEPMTLDTIFDAASLTKVVATTTAVMMLVEEGRLRLTDRVSAHVPEFGRYGKDAITVRHLLTHSSGLRPDLDWSYPWSGYDTAIQLAVEEVPVAGLDERVIYSDINFFLLGDIVARASGLSLDRFVADRIFRPLGMRDTGFLPAEALRPRIAPTEKCTQYDFPCGGPEGTLLRGVVHDPTARRMGGVAGHAGLFTTADDLARFAQMLLAGGTLDGVRILSPLAVARMTSPATPPAERNVRGLGWDIDSGYASNRGELLPRGSFGHTGWTGTSLWIDPATETFVILLSNRVHPDGKGDAGPLRARVATAVGAALTDAPAFAAARAPFGGFALAPSGTPTAPPTRPAVVLTGIDVLRAEGFARLRGKRVGLVTNHTGRAIDGVTTIDLLHKAPDVTLAALFSPEHGIRGLLDEKVDSSVDERTGLPIHSLYGELRRPAPELLAGLDAIVIDLQDIGARFYTYTTTTAYVMEEAAKRSLPVFVLDRPNPINGWQIEGPTLDKEALGFVGYFPMPIRHGMTLGELARLFNGENKIGADLTVVEMKHWARGTWFDQAGLPWVNPSPNMRNLIQATLYPGIGAIEWTNISVGRGTDTPFEQVGAPWIDGVKLAEALNARRLPGISFYPVAFTPTSSKYANEECRGVFLVVTDRQALRPVRVGLEIASALSRLHRDRFDLGKSDKLLGSQDTLARLRAGEDPERIAASWAADEAKWRLLRAKYLIYR